jgi:RimJ/RimL family protein N-acetyltransferase
VLGLRLLMSSVLDGNDRSLRMQQAAGYEVIGRVPGRYWKRGDFRDDVMTCLTRERWNQVVSR